MKAVARAHQDRSLEAFQAALQAHPSELVEDGVVHAHLSRLYDTLLEQNLARLMEPYSRVEIAHLATLIKLPEDAVQAKLSQVRPRSLSCGPYSPIAGSCNSLSGTHGAALAHRTSDHYAGRLAWKLDLSLRDEVFDHPAGCRKLPCRGMAW